MVIWHKQLLVQIGKPEKDHRRITNQLLLDKTQNSKSCWHQQLTHVNMLWLFFLLLINSINQNCTSWPHATTPNFPLWPFQKFSHSTKPKTPLLKLHCHRSQTHFYEILISQILKSSQKNTTHLSKMHDFCFTIPYGLVLVLGGLIGYAKKGSLASLGGGAGAGLLLILAGYLSLTAFKKRKNSYFALILEAGMLKFQLFVHLFWLILFDWLFYELGFILNLGCWLILWDSQMRMWFVNVLFYVWCVFFWYLCDELMWNFFGVAVMSSWLFFVGFVLWSCVCIAMPMIERGLGLILPFEGFESANFMWLTLILQAVENWK